MMNHMMNHTVHYPDAQLALYPLLGFGVGSLIVALFTFSTFLQIMRSNNKMKQAVKSDLNLRHNLIWALYALMFAFVVLGIIALALNSWMTYKSTLMHENGQEYNVDRDVFTPIFRTDENCDEGDRYLIPYFYTDDDEHYALQLHAIVNVEASAATNVKIILANRKCGDVNINNPDHLITPKHITSDITTTTEINQMFHFNATTEQFAYICIGTTTNTKINKAEATLEAGKVDSDGEFYSSGVSSNPTYITEILYIVSVSLIAVSLASLVHMGYKESHSNRQVLFTYLIHVAGVVCMIVGVFILFLSEEDNGRQFYHMIKYGLYISHTTRIFLVSFAHLLIMALLHTFLFFTVGDYDQVDEKKEKLATTASYRQGRQTKQLIQEQEPLNNNKQEVINRLEDSFNL